jgi:hypothetical protein
MAQPYGRYADPPEPIDESPKRGTPSRHQRSTLFMPMDLLEASGQLGNQVPTEQDQEALKQR